MFNYQKKILAQLVAGKRAIFTRYGSGKGRATLAYAKHLAETLGRPIKLQIICPNHLTDTWSNQIDQWCPLDIQHTTIGKSECDPLHPAFSHAYIVPISNYSKPDVNKRTLALPPMDLVILDEGTCIKTPRTHRSHNILYLASTIWKAAHRLILSGNPTPEGPHEIWAQFQFAYGERNPLADTYYRCLNKWFVKAQYGWSLSHEKAEEFHAIIAEHSAMLDTEDFCEYRQHAPGAPTYHRYITDPSTEQRALLDELYTAWQIGEEQFSYNLELQQKASQICSGFFYTTDGTATLKEQPKAELLTFLLRRYLAEGHTRIAIWHRYKGEIPIIMQAIPQQAMPMLITADAPTQRQKHLDTFAVPSRLPIVMVIPTSMAKGINELKQCRVAIIYSNEWSQEARDQLESRHMRIGSSHKNTDIIDLCTSECLDLEVATALQNKNLTPERLRTIVHGSIRCSHD